MGCKFLPFRSEEEKRTTSGGSLQFPNGFPGKLLFQLTLNRGFWIFRLNAKQPKASADAGLDFLRRKQDLLPYGMFIIIRDRECLSWPEEQVV